MVSRTLRQRAERTKRRQVDIATAKLDGDRRAELETLCDRLTDRLLGGPLAALEVASERDDPELARSVATLFDIEDSGRAVGADDARETVPAER